MKWSGQIRDSGGSGWHGAAVPLSRKIGSVAGKSLEEAINSEEARHFRALLDVESNPICQRCVCSLNYKGGKSPDTLSTAQTQSDSRGN